MSAGLSPFGHQLRHWRRRRGLSQLELALQAESTPRHISFIETGRSRPGRELVLRLASAMGLPIRERNHLLISAGLSPAFPERELGEVQLSPFRDALRMLLDKHDPYPACALDNLGAVVMCNTAMARMFAGADELSAEQGVDAFFGEGPMRSAIENWAEVAYRALDQRREQVRRSPDPRLLALLARAEAHMKRVPRPPSPSDPPPVFFTRFRVGAQVVRTFSTILRFEHAADVTLSELRVELIFPADASASAFFETLPS